MAEQTLTEKVRDAVNKYDPIGLIKIGCPKDEYEPEIKRIMPLLRTASNKEKFYNQVYSIFVEMFDEKIAGPKKIYRKLSGEVYELKKETRAF